MYLAQNRSIGVRSIGVLVFKNRNFSKQIFVVSFLSHSPTKNTSLKFEYKLTLESQESNNVTLQVIFSVTLHSQPTVNRRFQNRAKITIEPYFTMSTYISKIISRYLVRQ